MASAYLLLAACLASVAASAPTSPQQARMTLHPDASKRVVTWVSLEPAATSTVVQFGPAATFPAGATTSSSGRFRTYPIVTCPSNSSRSVHSATIDAPPGVATSWRGSSDGGVTWGDTYTFTAPADVNAYPLREALWGDMATYNAGNSAGQILRDVLRGDAQLLTHFGDTAYDMYDSCGAVGDAYLNDPAVTAYSTQAPLGVIYTPGNHESLHSGEDYSEFIYRLGDAQNELAAACGSGNNRYIAWRTGRVMHVSVDADAWIYPPVWSLAKPQYEWLEAFLPTVNRTETPWLVFYSHRALYCTKTTDGECNSEAETLRYGFFGVEYGLEALLHKFGVDFA